MAHTPFDIAVAKTSELSSVGKLMAEVYSNLDGFPSEADQPAYYKQFYSLSDLVESTTTEVIVAKDLRGQIMGGVVYFPEMANYGAGGIATTSIQNASAIRLLFVVREAQGHGLGRQITQHCIELAQQFNHSQVVLHTTNFMPAAWGLYEDMGFVRYPDIDFMQGELEVFGFQLAL